MKQGEGKKQTAWYGHVKAIGVIIGAARNNELKQSLASGHFGFVAGKELDSALYIINIDIATMMLYAGKWRQPTFYYCEIEDKNIIRTTMYRIADYGQRYHKSFNPYIAVGNSRIDDRELRDIVRGIDSRLELRLRELDESQTSIDITMNQVGIHAWYMRGRLYRDFYTNSL